MADTHKLEQMVKLSNRIAMVMAALRRLERDGKRQTDEYQRLNREYISLTQESDAMM